MPTLTIIDGFEHGIMAIGAGGRYAVTTGSPTIVTTNPRTGARCLELNPAATPENIEHPNFATQTGVLSFYLYFLTALPSAGVDLLVLDNVNGTLLLQFVSTAARLRVRATTGGLNQQIGPTLVADTWYLVDLKWDTSTNPGLWIGSVNGTSEGSVAPAQAAVNVTAAIIGTEAADTYTARYDDFVMSQTLADYPIGEHAVHKLSPSADGTHNITTSGNFDDITDAFSNATTTSWQNIDDVPLDTTNTADNIIRQDLGTTAEYMEHTFEDLPAGTNVPIDVIAYDFDVDAAAPGANSNIYRILLSDSTAVTPDVRASTEDPGTTVTMRKKMLNRPAGGWTRANVDGLKSRWGFGDNAPDAHLLGAMLEVAVGPPPPPGGVTRMHVLSDAVNRASRW